MCYLARGTRIGSEKKRFEVEAWLGFSEVRPHWELFAARDLETGDAVLVKAFPEVADEATPSSAFEREARRVSELRHPALASVLDFGVLQAPWGWRLRFVVEGVSPVGNLARLLAGRPPVSEVAPLAKPLADGVRYLREHDALVDVPAAEVFVPGPAQVAWGLYGLPSIPAEATPSALDHLVRAYPELEVA